MESFCFLEQTGQLGRKSTLKVFLPLWGSSETPANPECAAQELGKPNKQTDQCKARPQLRRCFHFLTGQALRWGRVIRPLVFPQLRGSAVWRVLLMRCTAGTGKQQLSRVNICLCASPDRLGKPRRENLRTVPELDQMAPSQLPSTGCSEDRSTGSDASFTLTGRSSTSEDEEEGSFAPPVPFPAHLLHQLSLLFLLCFPS